MIFERLIGHSKIMILCYNSVKNTKILNKSYVCCLLYNDRLTFINCMVRGFLSRVLKNPTFSFVHWLCSMYLLMLFTQIPTLTQPYLSKCFTMHCVLFFIDQLDSNAIHSFFNTMVFVRLLIFMDISCPVFKLLLKLELHKLAKPVIVDCL